jgi:hypothetical protein
VPHVEMQYHLCNALDRCNREGAGS